MQHATLRAPSLRILKYLRALLSPLAQTRQYSSRIVVPACSASTSWRRLTSTHKHNQSIFPRQIHITRFSHRKNEASTKAISLRASPVKDYPTKGRQVTKKDPKQPRWPRMDKKVLRGRIPINRRPKPRTVPSRFHPLVRRNKRERLAGKGTSDTEWMRELFKKIAEGNVDHAQMDWNGYRLRGYNLEDLRRVSKRLMRGYNEAGRWLDTIALFHWNENAEKFDKRGRRKAQDLLRREQVGIYLAELDLRAKIQKETAQQWEKLSTELVTNMQVVEKALDEMKEGIFDDEFDIYFEDLRDTLVRLRRLPPRFMEKPVPIEELRKLMDVSSVTEPFQKSTNGTGIDGQLLDHCFKALLGRMDSERVLTLFYQYQPCVQFTHTTWEYVLSAYINLGRFKKAQGLIRYATFREINLSHTCYTLILAEINTQRGSWEKMVRYFKWLEKISGAKVPAIYHIMIQAAVERGMNDEAKYYLQRMIQQGLPHTAKTCGDLLSAQAKVNDWEGLQKTLALIDNQGFIIPPGSFNAVLNAYAEAKEYDDTFAFFKIGLKRGIIPDKRTYNIMLKAALYAKGPLLEPLLPYWIKQMTQNGIQPNHYTFNTLFQDLRQNYGASAALLRRVYQKILRMHTSITVLNNVTKSMLLKTMHNEGRWYTTTYRMIWGDDIGQTPDKELIALRMTSAIEVGKPDLALDVWKLFLKEDNTPSLQMTILALRACIMSLEHSHLVPSILNAAKEHCLDIPAGIVSVIRDTTSRLVDPNISNPEDLDRLFTGYIETSTLKLDKIFARVNDVYNFLERNAIPITHHVAVHSANRLINAGEHHAAIQLLNQVALTTWGKQHPFDIVGYSVILKAYCRARDMNGIKWAVERIIAQRLKPNKAVLAVLSTLLNDLRSDQDEKKRLFIQSMIYGLSLHRTNLDNEAKIQSEILVEFIWNTVGLRKQRRYGSNWPLVTRGLRVNTTRRVPDNIPELSDETLVPAQIEGDRNNLRRRFLHKALGRHTAERTNRVVVEAPSDRVNFDIKGNVTGGNIWQAY